MKFSANLGFLWTEKSLPDAIRAAGANGFDAVECHWPFDTPAQLVAEALSTADIPMLALNTYPGNRSAGENGLTALPGREIEARAAIDEALTYALQVQAGSVHVMAGVAEGRKAEQTFVRNLEYAVRQAAQNDLTILIEPLNRFDAPGYFLNTCDQALKLLDVVQAPNLRIMFDCYHVARTEGNVIAQFDKLLPVIGHIQFAAVPDRGVPDHGTLDYKDVFDAIQRANWSRPLGAEYRPDGPTESTLHWMAGY